MDGHKGFPDAINAVFPETTVQTCILHLVRCGGFRDPTGATVPSNPLNFCGWKDRKDVAKDLKRVVRPPMMSRRDGARNTPQ
jgi:hypothetical protein